MKLSADEAADARLDAAQGRVMAGDDDRHRDAGQRHAGDRDADEGAAQPRHARRAASAGPESSDLGTKPRAPLEPDQRAEVGPLSAGGEDNRGRAVVGRQLGGHREAVGVGEVDVEEHEVGRELADAVQRLGAVGGLPHHVVALALEQHARRRPEARVVVDDEDGRGHGGIVADLRPSSYTATRTPPRRPARRTPRRARPRRRPQSPPRSGRRPACAASGAVCTSMPPSTSRVTSGPISSRIRAILAGEDPMNGWPPQPGLTVMHSATSSSPRTSASVSGGVAGLSARPAPQPASRIAPRARS